MDYGRANLKLLVRMVRALAEGAPLNPCSVSALVSEIGLEPDLAEDFLSAVTERNEDGNMVGVLGLSLKQHPHKFTVGGVKMTAWCAQDTLFLPVMLQRTATVETRSPQSGRPIRMTIAPDGVMDVHPLGVVMSTVIIDPNHADLNSPLEIQMAFCRNIHFFTSDEEVEQWAVERDGIVALSLTDAFDLGCRLWPEAYSYARALSRAA